MLFDLIRCGALFEGVAFMTFLSAAWLFPLLPQRAGAHLFLQAVAAGGLTTGFTANVLNAKLEVAGELQINLIAPLFLIFYCILRCIIVR